LVNSRAVSKGIGPRAAVVSTWKIYSIRKESWRLDTLIHSIIFPGNKSESREKVTARTLIGNTTPQEWIPLHFTLQKLHQYITSHYGNVETLVVLMAYTGWKWSHIDYMGSVLIDLVYYMSFRLCPCSCVLSLYLNPFFWNK